MSAPEDAVRQEAPGVLVIDDDPRVLRVAVTMLRISGIGAEGAADVETGLATLAAHPGGFAAVLLDHDVDGILSPASMPRIRAVLPGVPVVVMSGRSLDLAELPGAVSVLAKPFTIPVIVETMRAAMAASAAAAPVAAR